MSARQRISLAGPAPVVVAEPEVEVVVEWDKLNQNILNYLEHASPRVFVDLGPEPVLPLKEALRMLCLKLVLAERVVVADLALENITYVDSRRSVLRFPDLVAGTVRLRVLPHPQFACELLLKFKPPSALLREIDLMQNSLAGYVPPFTPVRVEYKKPDQDRGERQVAAILEATKEHLTRPLGEVALVALNALLVASRGGPQATSMKVLSRLLASVLPRLFTTAQSAEEELEQLVSSGVLCKKLKNAKPRVSQSESIYALITLSDKGALRLRKIGLTPAFPGVACEQSAV